MPLRLNTGFIIGELEKNAKNGHIAGDVEAPTWLLAAAAHRMTELSYTLAQDNSELAPPQELEDILSWMESQGMTLKTRNAVTSVRKWLAALTHDRPEKTDDH